MIEAEIKLGISPVVAAQIAKKVGLNERSAVTEKIYTRYFDTADFALYHRGVAVRLRQQGASWVQTLKVAQARQGVLSVRPEWEVPIAGEALDWPAFPGEALAYLQGIDAASLRPVFVTQFERRRRLLNLDGDQIEIALDRGEIRTSEAMGQTHEPLCELELEIKQGSLASLFALASDWAGRYVLRPEWLSKAERGYRLAGCQNLRPDKAETLHLPAKAGVHSVWHGLLTSALGQVTHNLAGVALSPDPEFVHQARVALRRLEAAAHLMRALGLPVPDWQADARWLMQALSEQRDADVRLYERLPQAVQALGPQSHLQPMFVIAEVAREVARQHLLEALSEARVVRFLLALGQSALSEPPDGPQARQWLNKVLQRRLRRVKALGERFESLDSEARHRLRLQVKKLRYALDASASVYGAGLRNLSQVIESLQDALGAANDARVTLAWLERLARSGAGLNAAQWRALGQFEGVLSLTEAAAILRARKVWDRLEVLPAHC
jgi:triphosphatase